MENSKLFTLFLLSFLMGCTVDVNIFCGQNSEVGNQTTSSTSLKYRKTLTQAQEDTKKIINVHGKTRTNRNPEFMLDYIIINNSTKSISLNIS